MREKPDVLLSACPVPFGGREQITLAHGGGGALMHELIEELFLPAFSNPALDARHDGAIVDVAGARLAFTTDTYVVRPLFFAGGDIGSLAIYGTINDLAMCGAQPLALSCGLVLEEGLATETLRRIVQSMREACRRAGVALVTGDTKVVERGKADGIYINTAGVGLVRHEPPVGPGRICAGDVILLNGDLGRHGVAVMAEREGFEFETTVETDSAPLAEIVLALIDEGLEIHCLRDLTRGGLATALVEIACAARRDIVMDERAISVCEAVRGACELLGLDPLYVANEGRFVAIVPQRDAERALALMRARAGGAEANIIGRVTEGSSGQVSLRTMLGGTRLVDMLSGEQLPRIC